MSNEVGRSLVSSADYAQIDKLGVVPDNKIAAPGDIVLSEIVLTSYTGFSMNVRGQFESMVIYEDLFSNSLSGTLVLKDSMNLAKHFPIVGLEKVRVVFYTPGDVEGDTPIELTFRGYSYESLPTSTDNTKYLTIELVSEIEVKNKETKISRSYRKMPYSKMVESLFSLLKEPEEETRYKTFITNTSGIYNLVIPFWTPLYAINWIASKSISASNLSHCDFVFYQSLDGTFNFVSLSDLKQRKVVAKYNRAPAGRRDEAGNLPVQDYLRNITNHTILKLPDYWEGQALGVYASNLTTFDITRKTISRTNYNYFGQMSNGNEPKVAEEPLLSQTQKDLARKYSSYRKFLPKHSYLFDGFRNNDNVELYALRHQSLMQRMNAMQLKLEVPGDSRLRVGDKINVTIPSTEDTKDKEEWRDTFLSGNYIITSVRHLIMDGSYSMELIVSRDSYEQPLPDAKEELKIS